jgi:hypothetical protein
MIQFIGYFQTNLVRKQASKYLYDKNDKNWIDDGHRSSGSGILCRGRV